MPTRPDRSVPSAILAGSAMIAAGLYFGLRSRDPAPPATPAPAPSTAVVEEDPSAAGARRVPADEAALAARDDGPGPAPVRHAAPPDAGADALEQPPTAPEPPPAPPLAPVTIPDLPEPADPQTAETTRLAADSLASARPTILEKCWRPVVTANPGLDHSIYDYDVTFDGQTGAAIALGISEHRGASRPDVAGCLRDLPLDLLQIEPQGRNVGVKVRLTLP